MAIQSESVDASGIAVGGVHNLLVRDDGTLWAWGGNAAGQLGDGTRLDRTAPVQVFSGITAAAAGNSYTLALRSDGTLWSWGNDGLARSLTPVQILSDVQAIAAGGAHAFALRIDGTLWAWGNNRYGQLGDSTTVDQDKPIQILSGVKSVAAGGYHSLALKGDGSFWAWGRNDHGQLGDGTHIDRSSPIPGPVSVKQFVAGGTHSLAQKIDGSLWAWGDNTDGQLGDGTTTDRSEPVNVTTRISNSVQKLAAGANHSLALDADGTLRAWGYNNDGEVGDGTTTNRTTPIVVLGSAQAIAAGSAHSLALKVDGSLWAWGDNLYGQLGDGTTLDRALPLPALDSVRTVAAGTYHSLAIRDDATLWSWGQNGAGQLGDGTRVDRATPAQILTTVQGIAAGYGHSLALRTDGSVWTWGDNSAQQLGDGGLLSRSSPAQVLTGARAVAAGSLHSLAIRNDATLWSWGIDNLSNSPTPVQVLTEVQAVAGGDGHTLALRTDGTLWAWGYNGYGEIGDGTLQDRHAPVQILSGVDAIAAGGAHSLARKNDGTVWAWGANTFGEVGNGTTTLSSTPVQILGSARAIAAGEFGSMAINADSTVSSWGKVAQPGGGGEQSLPQPNPFLAGIVGTAMGDSHALALTSDGRALTWGNNRYQQLAIARSPRTAIPVRVRDPLAPYGGADLVVEFFNPTIKNGAGTSGIGHYFITASAAEAASIDTGGSGPGWARTGRTFRAWPSLAAAPAGAVGVCRFYARVPNSHFYTADATECQSLKNLNPLNDPNLGWSYEGIAFYTILPHAGGSSCGVGYFPIYRSYNNRFNADPALNDGNHRLTPSYTDYQRSIHFLGYTDEGLAFCSPASTSPGADLQAAYSYPVTTQPAVPFPVPVQFGNNGAGSGDGATLYISLPAEATWNVACASNFGAVCPATGDLDQLREGLRITTWPAGGTFTFTAAGVSPQVQGGGSVPLDFAVAVAAATGSPDPNPANNMPPRGQTVIKGLGVCNAVLNPTALQLGPAAQSPHVDLRIGSGCGWSAHSNASWLTVSPPNGNGDASVTILVAANAVNASRSGTVSINGSTITVAQSAAPTAQESGAVCATLRLQREGDQIAPNGLTGPAAFDVIADAPCGWRAQSNAPWITLTAGGGTGNGTVRYLVEPNASAASRSGTIAVNARLFTINQLGSSPGTGAAASGDGGGDGGGSGDGGGASSGGAGAGG